MYAIDKRVRAFCLESLNHYFEIFVEMNDMELKKALNRSLWCTTINIIR